MNNQIPIPPPLTLPPPTISNHSFQFAKKQKYLLMMEDSQECGNLSDEIEKKYKNVYDSMEQKYSKESEATGQGNMVNITLYFQCQRCHRWILKSEEGIHMSCHAAIVYENLLLGDKFSCKSRKQMIDRQKITHIVNCAQELKNYFQQDGIKYLKLNLYDDVIEEPIEEFQRAARFIKDSIDEGGRVFVHCAVGKSRSVSSILMYMLEYQGIPIEEGLKIVQKVRPIAKPNVNYMKRLRQFEKQFLEKKQ